jgi:predicted ATPase
MKLLRYRLSSVSDDTWQFDEVAFGRINLIVGDSGTGKSRFINTIVNFTKQLVGEAIRYDGDWDIDFDIAGKVFNYRLVVKNAPSKINTKEVVQEHLICRDDNEVLVKRDASGFYWKNKDLPKLSTTITAISLLKDEEEVRDIYNGFRAVVARRFSGNELSENFQFGALAPNIQKQLHDKQDVRVLLNEPIDFHNKMNLLRTMDAGMYSRITELFKQAFPYILDTSIQTFSQMFQTLPMGLQAPVFCIKEKNIKNWIPTNDISSGMQKIFLLILDLFLMKDSGILLIDEYENSLGINAINFLPDLIHSISDTCQFIITSHHPYIINNIPIEQWHVFHRSGLVVQIKSGKELRERYKASKQEHFVQLINDPFYTGGVE